MRTLSQPNSLALACLALACCAGGCHTVPAYNEILQADVPPDCDVPRELDKITLPRYVIEPPDILLIDAVKIVPRSPYQIESQDILQIQVAGTLPEAPIMGNYPVSPGGTVDLGPAHGPVKLAGLTLEEARQRLYEQLSQVLREPEVSVSLAQSAGEQQIAGEHLVAPDGTVHLGTYGQIYITGMSLSEAKQAIEEHLSQFLEDPEVSVDVFSYNSKAYYIIAQTVGFGDQVTRVPITGNETVLDAMAQIGGTNPTTSKRIWISRPTPHGTGYDQILPVHWDQIVQGGSTTTNYQIMPGDRLYIAEDKLAAVTNFISNVTQPIERVFGFTLLGVQSIQTINRLPTGQISGQQSFF